MSLDLNPIETSIKNRCVETPNQCPRCFVCLDPSLLSVSKYSTVVKNEFYVAVFLCRKCMQPFTARYSVYGRYVDFIGCVEPQGFETVEQPDLIAKLSPSFVEIYNEALKSETFGCRNICGMGYRKALEILIKDYLIHLTPDDRDTIAGMRLGKCISDRINNEKLKTVASRCAWLGNDHSHYIQCHEDRDLSDLKKLVEATVYWITMELITEDSLKITKR